MWASRRGSQTQAMLQIAPDDSEYEVYIIILIVIMEPHVKAQSRSGYK